MIYEYEIYVNNKKWGGGNGVGEVFGICGGEGYGEFCVMGNDKGEGDFILCVEVEVWGLKGGRVGEGGCCFDVG